MAPIYSLLSKALRQSSTNLSRVDYQPVPCLKAPRKGLKNSRNGRLVGDLWIFSKSLDMKGRILIGL